MDKLEKAVALMRTYGASEEQVSKWLARQSADAIEHNVCEDKTETVYPLRDIGPAPSLKEIDAKARQVAIDYRQLYAEVEPDCLRKVREKLAAERARMFCANAEHWEPRNPEIIVIPGTVGERLRFCARKADGYVGLFMVRMSELDKGAEAEIVDCRNPAHRRKLVVMLDCGWILPQLLAAREQHEADLWAIIKGDKQ